MFQNFAFYLWVSLFCFVNNKGMYGMLILDIFIWQLSSIYGPPKMRKRRQEIIGSFVCIPSNYFFFFSKIPILYKRKPLELRAQKVEKFRSFAVLPNPSFYTTVPCFQRALRNGKYKCRIKSQSRALLCAVHSNVSLCSQENSAVFLFCILFK